MIETTGNFIAGKWIAADGPALISHDPASGEAVWSGAAATSANVNDAVSAARKAQPGWMDISVKQRATYLHAFAQRLTDAGDAMVEAICLETGKPRWEAKTEVNAMIGKAAITAQAFNERRRDVVTEQNGATTATRYKPHGVLAVIGPFNFPGHIPNGHIMPALLAGNTIVFKPSELTPLCGQRLAEAWQAADLPAGVLNLVQGGRDTGVALTSHAEHDGILFTGSFKTGLALRRALLEMPQKILALELGGNNALVVDAVDDVDAAAYLTILSAYLTAGQRCTCARRLIVPNSPGNQRFLDRLVAMIASVRVGRCSDTPEPFMGPVITDTMAEKLLRTQDDLLKRGGASLAKMKSIGPRAAMLTPGLIDVTDVPEREDTEWFGPLLQLIRVPDFDSAIAEANRTAYGLVAGLISDDRARFEQFHRHVRAGLINWNRHTTGASSALPFGGVGHSGNHRPSGYFAVDYCNYPVASLENPQASLPETRLPGIDI